MIEMARASGLALVTGANEPLAATMFGTRSCSAQRSTPAPAG